MIFLYAGLLVDLNCHQDSFLNLYVFDYCILHRRIGMSIINKGITFASVCRDKGSGCRKQVSVYCK